MGEIRGFIERYTMARGVAKTNSKYNHRLPLRIQVRTSLTLGFDLKCGIRAGALAVASAVVFCSDESYGFCEFRADETGGRLF
jgi:hypothetical protein